MNAKLLKTILILFALPLPQGAAAALPPGEILTRNQVADLVASARLDLSASAGLPKTVDELVRAFERARDEPDAVRREAMLSVWLREWVGPEPTAEPPSTVLQGLTSFEPVAKIVHHEHPERPMPAFHVAAHASNRLNEQSIRRLAATMVNRPASIGAALSTPVGSEAFRAGLRAAVRSSKAVRASLAGQFAAKRGARADAATLALIDAGLIETGALVDVIAHAPSATALLALRKADLLDAESRAGALQQALARPELGGLPIAMAAALDLPGVVPQLWALLDDRDRGADAALALARTVPNLATQVDQRFATASHRARLRMRLALKLQDSPESRAWLARFPSGSSAQQAPAATGPRATEAR